MVQHALSFYFYLGIDSIVRGYLEYLLYIELLDVKYKTLIQFGASVLLIGLRLVYMFDKNINKYDKNGKMIVISSDDSN